MPQITGTEGDGGGGAEGLLCDVNVTHPIFAGDAKRGLEERDCLIEGPDLCSAFPLDGPYSKTQIQP